MKQLNVGIVGTGFGSFVQMPAVELVDGLRLKFICDNGSGRAAGLVSGDVRAFSDWRVALDAEPVDLVIVAVPPAHQEAVVSAALALGCHVLCEKPATTTYLACDRIRNLAELHKVIVAVGFQFRFEQGLQKLASYIQDGVLGDLRSINIQWHTGGRADPGQPMSWQNTIGAGGGVLLSHSVHLLDLMRWFGLGKLAAISGTIDTRIPRRPDSRTGVLAVCDAEDYAAFFLQDVFGVTGFASIGNSQPGGQGLRIEVLGSNATAIFSHEPPFTPESQKLSLHQGRETTHWNGSNLAIDTRIASEADLLRRLSGSIRGEVAADLPTIQDACAVHSMLDELRTSMRAV